MAEAPARKSVRKSVHLVNNALAADCLGENWNARTTPLPAVLKQWHGFFTGDPVKDHDIANVVFISVILALDVSWSVANKYATDALASLLFTAFFYVSLIYFIADALWIAVVPKSCKTPGVVIGHHVVVIFYMSIPFFYPEYGWCMAACLSVETCTVLLIVKRLYPHRMLEAAFYTAWVVIRLIYYPYLCWAFFQIWVEVGPWHLVIFAPIFQVLLTCLSYFWTYTLVVNMLRRRKKP
uniref:TLC domain-containing protein n=1 Tax=Noctiluca scintillans TaxID=2966 RepID=A0A7S1AL57_NOCSC|mmetsp:Transcript_50847/g.135741  ORF Transcript_50847/g.135741 Transcript_50847/m.135741 type:complete len:238 (+) Transcript_50847:44-757(+)